MTHRTAHLAPALLALGLLAACGPNDLALGAFQYGSQLGGMALDSLHDANDQDITKGAAGHAGARGLAGALAGQ